MIFAVLRNDSDLQAFCLDFFPNVAQRFSNSMDRIDKTSQLLEQVRANEILSALRTYNTQLYDSCFAELSIHSSRNGKLAESEACDIFRVGYSNRFTQAKQSSWWSLAITLIGMVMLIAFGIDRTSTIQYQYKFYVALGALAGLYILFGFLFAHISMFPKQQRGRILALLVVALIILTFVLGARAAYYYHHVRAVAVPGALPINEQTSKGPLPIPASDAVDMQFPNADLSDSWSLLDGGSSPVTTRVVTQSPISRIPTISTISPADMSEYANGTMDHVTMSKYKINGEFPQLPDSIKVQLRCKAANASYKICVGIDGNVNSVEAIQGIPMAGALIMQFLRKWRYKTQAIPLCFVQPFDFGGDVEDDDCAEIRDMTSPIILSPSVRPRIVPAVMIKKDKISGDEYPHLPEDVKLANAGSVVTGSYKVCIGKSGNIEDVQTVNGIPGADHSIMTMVRTWRYKPQPIPICFIQFFEFHFG